MAWVLYIHPQLYKWAKKKTFLIAIYKEDNYMNHSSYRLSILYI